jgi:hypothetical protein
MIVCVLAPGTVLASPASAGGDWDYGWGHRHQWREGYRAYYGPPAYYVPPVYVPYAYPYVVDRDDYDDDDECEIERKWRHGRYVEWLDCDD